MEDAEAVHPDRAAAQGVAYGESEARVILEQFYLNCLAHASYLVGDEETRTAAVVDPQRDIDRYLECASEHGLRIAHVFLTHFHADFLAGHLELRDRAGAAIYLGAAARAEYAFTPLSDGDLVEFGGVRLQALETPGYTPESICLLVYDLAKSETTPHAVLTGDTLFVGDVGRPDLRAALGWSASDLGARLYASLRDKLLPLPDSSLVYPAHGAGSLCGKAISRETVSTIGEQRLSNYALQPMSKAAFIDLVTADQPDAPAYSTYDAVLNSRERATLDELLAEQARGAQVLDTREPASFAAAHPGREHQYRPRRPVRHVGRHGVEPRAPDRAGRRSRHRGGIRAAPGAHRFRSRDRLSGGRPRKAPTRRPRASGPPSAWARMWRPRESPPRRRR